MGGIQAKHLKEILDDELPSTPSNGMKRIIEHDFDPRSPSFDIVRTPIRIDQTPVAIHDPRSPTEGIARTPLYLADDTATPPILPSLSAGETVSEAAEPCEAAMKPAEACEAPTPVRPVTESRVLSQQCNEQEQITTTGKQETSKFRRSKPLIRLSLHSSGKLSDKQSKASPSSKVVTAELSPGRSPLRSLCVDNKCHENSPLKIVQNKQASKLGFLKNAPKNNYEVFTDEKENVTESWTVNN